MRPFKHDSARRDHYQELTDAVIARLEEGTPPWRRPWDPSKCAAAKSPMNPVTGRSYRGVNALALALSPLAFAGDPRWMTYRQAAERGWQVRKGEKGAIVFFYKKLELRDRQGDDDERRTIPLLRAYTVFHASQIDGVPELGGAEGRETRPRADRRRRPHREGERRPGRDRRRPRVLRPRATTFACRRTKLSRPRQRGNNVLHELGHASGAPHRLNRDLSGHFGDTAYSREELRAELASYFVGSALDLPCDVPNHVSYIQSWIKVLKSDTREIFRAAADASRIADWILSHHPDHGESRDPASEDEPSPAPTEALAA